MEAEISKKNNIRNQPIMPYDTNSTKSQKERMLNEEYYYGVDNEIDLLLADCRKKLKEFNDFKDYDNYAPQKERLVKLLGKTGENPYIQNPFYCDFGSNIHVGNNFFANFDCVILDCAEVSIGHNVMLAPKVQILTISHPINPMERTQGLQFAKKVLIGNNVWIGAGAIILPGIKIGDYSVVGAGSVVTKDVPENVVVAGNPCKVIRAIEISKA